MDTAWLNNKCIVIVGATAGIGLSAASMFIKQGAKVVAVGRNEEVGLKAQNLLGKNAFVLCGNAVNPDTSINAIEACVEKFGDFNGLYHVAGGSGRKMGDGPLHEMTLEGWNKTIELNLTSLMLSNQAAVRWFLKVNKSGSIVNMGSILGFSPSPVYFATHAYAATKSAVIGFTKSLAAYYAKNNIRFNVLVPGLVETPMSQRASKDEKILAYIKTKQPLDGGRNGQPGDLDGLACYLLSDYSRFTTGQVIAVDGGWSISEGQINF